MSEEKRAEVIANAINGVVTTGTVSGLGIHRGVLRELVTSGELVRCSRGIYMLADEWEDEYYLLQQKYKRGIYSNRTALYLLGYSERVPVRLHMTFPANYNTPSLKNENVTVKRVIKERYGLGIREVQTPYGNTVTCYDTERCLCDMLFGEPEDLQSFLYAIKKYTSSPGRDINRLTAYAALLHVDKKLRRYLEVLL